METTNYTRLDRRRQILKDMTIFIAYIKNYTISMFKNTNKIIKFLPDKIFSFTTKSFIYVGLALYWCVIILGTFINIV